VVGITGGCRADLLVLKYRLGRLSERSAPEIADLVRELHVGPHLAGVRDVHHPDGLAGGDNTGEAIDHLSLRVAEECR
jgi:hypothetical protein